jgi:hypothetical protein
MGMYSDFPRVAGDRYFTPFSATLPLAPFLAGVRTFAEPCKGDGELVAHVESHGPLCIHSGDIAEGVDALNDPELEQLVVDRIITNPPYKWKLLKPLIQRFVTIAPTWLLLEDRFLFGERSGPFMRICTDVVTIGRVKWFPDTEHASRINYAWFLFDQAKCEPTRFHRNPYTGRQMRSIAAARTSSLSATKGDTHAR